MDYEEHGPEEHARKYLAYEGGELEPLRNFAEYLGNYEYERNVKQNLYLESHMLILYLRGLKIS